MRILVTEPLHEAGIKHLEREFVVDVKLGMSPAYLLSEVPSYDGLITRSGTAVRADLLLAARERLKVVGRAGIGVDNIDIRAATEHGIAVVNAPLGNVRAAAEHTIALMFALCRNIPQAHNLLREGVWGKNHFVGSEVAGKTLGIIGLGKVGKQVARRALALDMDVIAYDPFIEPNGQIPLVSLHDLLRRSDFVTLHVPLTPLTANLISGRELRLMKDTAFLINCARGKVVDEDAVYDMCKSGRIAGAALDVFANEPLSPSALFELNNVIVTPHLGGTTREAMEASAVEVAAQVRAVLVGEQPEHILNPEVLRPRIEIGDGALNKWERFGRVVFDCDSTLSEIEGINELAAMNGVPYEVSEMTRLAMGGQVPFEQVFGQRLDLIRPHKGQLQAVGRLYTASLVEDATLAVAALTSLGIEVRLVSGGYRDALLPMARKLGVPASNLHANALRFTDEGDYLGYDTENPLCRTGGKADVLRQLPGKPRTLVVGDGASDAEVSPDVDLFVGYGGVEKRGLVQQSAPVYLHAQSLAPVVVLAAGLDGCMTLLQDERFRQLVVKGLALLMRSDSVEYQPEYAPFVEKVRKFCLEGICN